MNKVGHVFAVIGKDIVIGAEDVGKVIIWIPQHLVQTIKVLVDVVKDSPAVRDELKRPVGKVAALDTQIAKDIAEKGMSLEDDLLTIKSIKDLLSFLKGELYQAIAVAYKDIAADMK